MQIDLVNQFRIRKNPHVLYDKATKKFGSISVKEKHELFKKLGLKDQSGQETLLTTYDNQTKQY